MDIRKIHCIPAEESIQLLSPKPHAALNPISPAQATARKRSGSPYMYMLHNRISTCIRILLATDSRTTTATTPRASYCKKRFKIPLHVHAHFHNRISPYMFIMFFGRAGPSFWRTPDRPPLLTPPNASRQSRNHKAYLKVYFSVIPRISGI